MLRGEHISIQFPQYGEPDPFGQAQLHYGPTVDVDDVLVEPGSGSDEITSTMPNGVEITFTLRFPRAWPYQSLKDALIRVRDTDCKVIGDPKPFDGGITPTRWNMNVQVSAIIT